MTPIGLSMRLRALVVTILPQGRISLLDIPSPRRIGTCMTNTMRILPISKKVMKGSMKNLKEKGCERNKKPCMLTNNWLVLKKI